MSSLLDCLSSVLDPNAVSAISQQIGAPAGSTQGAIGAALPMLVSALARNASTPGGANALATALQDHDGAVLQQVPDAVATPEHQATGEAILGHLLGGNTSAVGGAVGQVSGLSAGQGGQLLSLLAPLVMGALGQQARQGGFDASSLAGFLGQEHASVAQTAPQHQSLLSSILDRNGDGSVADDVGRIGLGVLGNLLNRR